jgi:hypothetical protein
VIAIGVMIAAPAISIEAGASGGNSWTVASPSGGILMTIELMGGSHQYSASQDGSLGV